MTTPGTPPSPATVPLQARGPRWAALGVVAVSVLLVLLAPDALGERGRALLGILCFLAIVAACSTNLAAVSWRTVGWGFGLQLVLAFFILKFEIGGVRPGLALFTALANAVRRFLEFTNAGSQFVFGQLADQQALGEVLPNGFVFAFTALPTIIFVSSFFTLLYYFGLLQLIVRLMARVMMYLMRTSGAETLAAAANVFMGQTEAPIIVKPYIAGMTQSELLALMVGGMATISGGVMAVYIGLGADPVAILATSVMAAPAGLYLSKILLPETEEPATRGEVTIAVERQHVNVIDAIASGASDGSLLAFNVAAMLIAFLAFIAMLDFVLGSVFGGLTLAGLFSVLFAPLALLIGVPLADVGPVADLLGTKLVATEFVAYIKLTTEYRDVIDPRSHTLATYALTGFANFGSVGILLGGVGPMAPGRRGDLARLGLRALLGGFLATMVNAAIASLLL